jgi:pimeloyl-ACP methyl ester carboxylesterase
MPPTMVVHDRLDKEVPYDEGAKLGTTWPSAELVTTEGLGHQRILRDPEVINHGRGTTATEGGTAQE